MTGTHMSADEAARLIDEDTDRIIQQQESYNRQYVSVAHDGTTFRGSLEETAKHFGISEKTVKWYASPSGKVAQSESSPRVTMDYRPISGGFHSRTIEQRMGSQAKDVMMRCMTGSLSISEGARILGVGRSTLSRFRKRIKMEEPAHRITRGYGRILKMSRWQQDEIRKCALGKSNIQLTADTIMEDEKEVERLVRIYQEEHKIV